MCESLQQPLLGAMRVANEREHAIDVGEPHTRAGAVEHLVLAIDVSSEPETRGVDLRHPFGRRRRGAEQARHDLIELGMMARDKELHIPHVPNREQ